MSGDALAAVLGMLRSPTGRPAAVTFLRAVSALLGGPPAPPDWFRGDMIAADEANEGQEAGAQLAGSIGRYGGVDSCIRELLFYHCLGLGICLCT